MKNVLLTLMVVAMATTTLFTHVAAQVSTQEAGAKIGQPHRIVFQLATDDTVVHKMLMKQLNNIKSIAPDAQIEVVCHGPGLNMLMKEKTIVQEKIKQLKTKDVAFVACEFAMSERNVTKDKMIPEAGYVKAGIIEIVSRQEAGWSYIKAGF